MQIRPSHLWATLVLIGATACEPARPTPVEVSLPAIYLLSPTEGTVLTGTVTLQAVTDDPAALWGVRFMADGTLIAGEDTAPPFEVDWDTGLEDNRVASVQAIARTLDGHLSPSNTARVNLSNTGTIRAEVTVGGGGRSLDSIQVYLDGEPAVRVGGDGGHLELTGIPNGNHVIDLGGLTFNCQGGPQAKVRVTGDQTLPAVVTVQCVDVGVIDQRIAFSAYGPGGCFDIFVVDFVGAEPVPIASGPECETEPDWSADGTRIAFMVDSQEIWTINADGSDKRRVTPADGSWKMLPKWSPDGMKILHTVDPDPPLWDWYHGPHRLWIVNSDGSDPRQITFDAGSPEVTPGHDLSQDLPGGWSADGSRILFQKYYVDGTDRSDFFVINADGSGLTRVSEGFVAGFAPKWSPDESRIAFGHYTPDPWGWAAATVGTDGTGFTIVASPNAWEPKWIRDASWLVFLQLDSLLQVTRLVMARTDGSQPLVVREIRGARELAISR